MFSLAMTIHALFHNVIGSHEDASCPPASVLVLTPEGLFCDGETVPAARLAHCMWWIGEKAYTSGEIYRNVLIEIAGQPALGPFPRLRLVADYLYAGDRMIARVLGDKWRLYDQPIDCESIRLVSRD